TTGSAINALTVVGTRAGEPLTLSTAGGLDDVKLGDGSVQGLRGDVRVTNPVSFSDVTVDNSRDVNFAANVFVSPTSIKGLAPATIWYNPTDLNDLEIKGGGGPTTYRITGAIAGSFIELTGGASDDVFLVGNNGVV